MYVLIDVCSNSGVERHADEKITKQTRLYFDNQGLMKIKTTQWNLVAFYGISYFFFKRTTNKENKLILRSN